MKEHTGNAKDDTRDDNTERRAGSETGVAFLQHKDLVPDAAGCLFPDISCYKCNHYGHYATSCITPSNKRLPIPKKEGAKDTKNKPPDDKGQQMLQIKEESETADDIDKEHRLMFIQYMDMYKAMPPLMEDWEESNSSDDKSVDESVGPYGTESNSNKDSENSSDEDENDNKNDNDGTVEAMCYVDDIKFASKRKSRNSMTKATGSNAEVGLVQRDQSKQSFNIPKHWVLLDSQLTVSVFNNVKYLTNIRTANRQLKVISNGGTQILTQIGDITNFGTVWHNPKSLENILLLAEVRKNNRVTMDTEAEAAMIVHRKDGTQMKFVEFETGILL